ncbi:MAG: hypothetical protein J6Y64_03870 [Ruminococcus sp.]|nr:hypothetical protein [Ruminococcus sp.]
MKAVQSGGCEAAVSHTDEAKLSELRWYGTDSEPTYVHASQKLPSAVSL